MRIQLHTSYVKKLMAICHNDESPNKMIRDLIDAKLESDKYAQEKLKYEEHERVKKD